MKKSSLIVVCCLAGCGIDNAQVKDCSHVPIANGDPIVLYGSAGNELMVVHSSTGKCLPFKGLRVSEISNTENQYSFVLEHSGVKYSVGFDNDFDKAKMLRSQILEYVED